MGRMVRRSRIVRATGNQFKQSLDKINVDESQEQWGQDEEDAKHEEVKIPEKKDRRMMHQKGSELRVKHRGWKKEVSYSVVLYLIFLILQEDEALLAIIE